MRNEELITRDEVVALLFSVHDAVDELRAIRALLEDGEDGEEVQEDLE